MSWEEQLFQLYQGYYQHEIFNTKAELDLMVYSEIVKVDPSVETLITEQSPGGFMEALDIIDRELIALNVELFGLAWLDYNYKLFDEEEQDQNKCDVALTTEIMFAKHWFEGTFEGKTDIWSAAGVYNRTILEAAIAQSNTRDWSASRDMGGYHGVASFSLGEKAIKFNAQVMLEHFDKFLNDKVYDKECALRLSNRLASINCWRDGIMIPQKLSSAFAERLSVIPNSETLFLFQRLVVGLYNNAGNFINAVIEYGSWELARKATIDLRQSLFEAGCKLLERQNESDKPELP